jgi:hypothetical protein
MKTAVQWLDEQIKEKMGLDEHDTNQLKWFINKAIEKEKEQITNAHWAGWGHAYDYYVTEAESYDSQAVQAEDYYNETYTQNK